MTASDLATLNLPAAALTRLQQLGLASVRDIALFAESLEQQQRLAAHLGIEPSALQAAVEESLVHESRLELQRLRVLAQQPHPSGVIPPNEPGS